ncbi:MULTISPECIES: hypothetical protein [unclassified Streptomyces]|uniref:hypothetical protein n=1 Tax=unclassified Streptomyces TaxID=2593676 RepID=UPI0029660D33|nr:hypothetical protein [Streptomyces sp. SJL17-1]
MHDTDPRDLESFATILAGDLPGRWTSQYHPDHGGTDYDHLAAEVWDMDQTAHAIATYGVFDCAVLTRTDDGARLFVIDHLGKADGFLVAAMSPVGLPAAAYSGVREPDGLAVPADPFHAAEAVTLHLLPRYADAVAHARRNAAALASPLPDQVELTWADGALTTPVPNSAPLAKLLAEHGFHHDTAQDLLVLPGDDTAVQARAVRAVGARLAELGVGIGMRHPSRPALAAAGPLPARTAPSAARSR